MKPPVIHDKLFDQLKTDNPSLIVNRFHDVYGEFRDYFNAPTSCLTDIQQIRKKCGATPQSLTTIFPSDLKPEWDGGHAWYAYHWGGRSEPQFNIGMEVDENDKSRFRVGLGFEFTPLQNGKPELVKEHFEAFIEVVKLHEDEFRDFVDENKLRLQWVGKDFMTGKIAGLEEKTRDVVKCLKEQGNSREWTWVFIGRFLRRGWDKPILEDPDRLGTIIESVFSGFKPFWAETLCYVSAKVNHSTHQSVIRRKPVKPEC